MITGSGSAVGASVGAFECLVLHLAGTVIGDQGDLATAERLAQENVVEQKRILRGRDRHYSRL